MRVNISEVLNRSSTRLNPRLKPPALSCTWLDYAHQGTLTARDSPIRPYEVSTPTVSPSTCGATQPFYHSLHIYPIFHPKTYTTPTYTTPTPEILILRNFRPEPPKSERDFCIETPIFRWTPLPTAIPSRRISPLLPRNCRFSTQNSHAARQQPIKTIYLISVLNPHSPHIATYRRTPPHLYSKATNILSPQLSTGPSQFNQALRPHAAIYHGHIYVNTTPPIVIYHQSYKTQYSSSSNAQIPQPT